MITTIADHVFDFYALGGETIVEVAKNYTSFEQSLTHEDFDADAFFSSIKPKNFRQELFRVKLLLKLNRVDDLFKILLEDSKIVSKLALRNCGLIQRLASMKGEDLVKQVLEELSYTTRTQLINNLSFSVNDESKGLELYNAVLDKYGMKVALPLLVACAKEVITEAIEENDVKFTHRQLIRCYKKCPKILEVYFRKNSNFHDHSKLGQYLCLHDLATFHGLLKFGVPDIRKRAFIKYLRVYKNEFVKDVDKLRPLLRHNVLAKFFEEGDFVAWVGNLLPKNVDHFCIDGELRKYLEMVPYKIRGRVFFAAFKNRYGFEIWSNQDYISDDLLEILPLEDRRKFDLADFVQYESTEKGVPALERQLSLTTQLNERISFVTKIVKNCKVNRDYDALLGVLKKFTLHHKNEHKRLRCEFLELLNQSFNFQKFTREHCEYIDKIVMQFHVNGDDAYSLDETLQKLIEFDISNGLDYSLHMKLYCKYHGLYGIPVFSKKPEEQRAVILKYYSLMNERLVEEEAHMKAFMETVVSFNHQHRRDSKMQIPLLNYKHSLGIIVDDTKEKYPSFNLLNELLNCLHGEGVNADGILSEIFIASSTKYEPYAQSWFLWKRQNIIENNIDSLFKDNKLHTRFCYELSKLENTSLKKKVVDCALEALRDPKNDTARICNSLKILSFCPEINFHEHTKAWLPADCKIDVHKEDMKGLFEIQKALLLSYKNRPRPQEVIPEILQFCNGDYLQYALDPLYYVCNNIPQRDLLRPLNELLGRSVGVRKHALHLITLLTPLEFRREALKTLAENERNGSVKRFIIKKLFMCLQNDRTETDWDFFSSHLHFVDPDDTEIIAEFLSSRNVPKKFYTKFVHLLWRHLSERGNSEEFKLINSIDYNKFAIDDSCEKIVRESLFNPANNYTTRTYTFTFKYLVENSSNLKNKIEFIWECVRENCKTEDRYKMQKNLHEFISYICEQVLEENSELQTREIENGFDAIKTMRDLLPALKTHNKFQLNLLLETTQLYRLTEPRLFGKCVTEKLKLLLDDFGLLIVKIYARFLDSFLKIVVKERFSHYILDLIEDVLRCEDSTQTRVFCIGLLPPLPSKDNCLRDKYIDVLKKLEKECYAIVDIEIEDVILGSYF